MTAEQNLYPKIICSLEILDIYREESEGMTQMSFYLSEAPVSPISGGGAAFIKSALQTANISIRISLTANTAKSFCYIRDIFIFWVLSDSFLLTFVFW